jgi:hypothetical protein
MRRPMRLAFFGLRAGMLALALASAGGAVTACKKEDTLGEKIDETTEEIKDEIDDHTDDK